jgi:DNA-binding winged helix-turn-helix (wHTH) protein
MSEEKRTTYRFGDFTVDSRRRVVLREGEAVPLVSKAFDLLLVLLESEGRELSKEELMSRIWADQIVEDANLTVAMAQLRKALGEKASDHRLIVTIPGRGYRFVGDLQREEALIDSAPASPQSAAEEEKATAAANCGGGQRAERRACQSRYGCTHLWLRSARDWHHGLLLLDQARSIKRHSANQLDRGLAF